MAEIERRETLERVLEPDGAPVPWLYVGRYSNKKKRVAKYYAIFTDWKGIRRRLPVGDELKKARKKLADVERKNDAEFDFDEAKARCVTLSQWADECKSAMTKRDGDSLPHLKEFFGNTQLSKITDKDLLDYRAGRQDELVVKRGKLTKKKTSPTTVNKELGLLRKFMRLALRKRHVQVLPKFVMAKEPNRERTLTAEEYKTLKEKAPHWLRRTMIASNGTCMNIRDLLGLTWAGVDRETWIITVMGGRNKTKVKQQIPIREPGTKGTVRRTLRRIQEAAKHGEPGIH